MEHPLINDVSTLTEEELQNKVSELTKKYMTAQRMGNAHLCQQITMALETYRNKLQEKYRSKKSDDDFEDKIDVS